jgi:hypothetical protein
MKKIYLIFLLIPLQCMGISVQSFLVALKTSYDAATETNEKDALRKMMLAAYLSFPGNKAFAKKVIEKYFTDKELEEAEKGGVGVAPSAAIAGDIKALENLKGADKARAAADVYKKILATNAKPLEGQIDQQAGAPIAEQARVNAFK